MLDSGPTNPALAYWMLSVCCGCLMLRGLGLNHGISLVNAYTVASRTSTYRSCGINDLGIGSICKNTDTRYKNADSVVLDTHRGNRGPCHFASRDLGGQRASWLRWRFLFEKDGLKKWSIHPCSCVSTVLLCVGGRDRCFRRFGGSDCGGVFPSKCVVEGLKDRPR